MIIVQICTGLDPFQNVQPVTIAVELQAQRFPDFPTVENQVVCLGYRPDTAFQSLVQACLNTDPMARPDASKILARLGRQFVGPSPRDVLCIAFPHSSCKPTVHYGRFSLMCRADTPNQPSEDVALKVGTGVQVCDMVSYRWLVRTHDGVLGCKCLLLDQFPHTDMFTSP
jgi:hypothetical protein